MIPKSIQARMGWGLHTSTNHPICLTKNLIYESFPGFTKIDDLDPIVSVVDNFDLLRIPQDHPSRSGSDTFYVSVDRVLRTHTSAHQVPLLRAGNRQFLVTGDVFRKDDIDQTHYPVFHQIEGVRICENPVDDLKATLSGLIEKLFPNTEFRFKEDFFPFTDPSWEVEVKFNDQWLEVLGCGIIHPEVLGNAGVKGTGWAFGLGLERLAMILFDIPDIRLFWSKDERYLSQFRSGIAKYVPISKHPSCFKDISMWVPPEFNHNELMELVRDVAGDLVESVKLIDTFAKNGRVSKCFRIAYRSLERTLTNEEIDELQDTIRARVDLDLGLQVR